MRNYVVQSSFFVLVAFLLSFGLVISYLLHLWYAVGLDVIFGVQSPAGKGLTTYIPSLIYLVFAMVISVIVGLLSTIYFEKAVAHLYSIALDRNARDYKLKKKWFRGITVTCVVVALLTHVVAGGSIMSSIDSLISTDNPRNYGRSLLVGLGGVWLCVSLLVEITVITVLRTIGIESVKEVSQEEDG
ncbi:hypothetical protein BRD17_08560 [Halobacteriales archaeon SW_7_68_16]|nr:MAG: hypothetical protein BRD17_08560 [Halobacteriales archaeon SW_7_68_16]